MIGTLVVVVPAAFGLFLLFASADRVFGSIRWLPLPEKDTVLYKALLTFWRALGVFALLFAVFGTYIIFFHS
jgi:hypothetical protein